MRRFWIIPGTDHHGIKRDGELKKIRKSLNAEAGVDESKVPSDQWPFKLAKGPDHPHNKPFFREVPLHAFFECHGMVHKKVSEHESKIYQDGVLSSVARRFNLNEQVHLVV